MRYALIDSEALETSLAELADAIRALDGDPSPMTFPQGMIERIRGTKKDPPKRVS